MATLRHRLSFLFLCLLGLGGCAYTTGSTVVTGTLRTPTNPAQVRLYLEPPSQYEVIGLVESSAAGWTAQESQDLALAEVKIRAAALGANGVWLLVSGTPASPIVLGASTMKTASGKALYVDSEHAAGP